MSYLSPKLKDGYKQFLSLLDHSDGNEVFNYYDFMDNEQVYLEFCAFGCWEDLFSKVIKEYPHLKEVVHHKSEIDYKYKGDFEDFSERSYIVIPILRFIYIQLKKSGEFNRTTQYVNKTIKMIGD